MRPLLSALATIAALVPGLVLGFQLAQWAAPRFCPPPNGPNLCALLGGVAIMGVVALGLGLTAGTVVWRAMTPPSEGERRLQ